MQHGPCAQKFNAHGSAARSVLHGWETRAELMLRTRGVQNRTVRVELVPHTGPIARSVLDI